MSMQIQEVWEVSNNFAKKSYDISALKTHKVNPEVALRLSKYSKVALTQEALSEKLNRA